MNICKYCNIGLTNSNWAKCNRILNICTCKTCGALTPQNREWKLAKDNQIQTHHKDGNRKNNNKENLMKVIYRHHVLIHHKLLEYLKFKGLLDDYYIFLQDFYNIVEVKEIDKSGDISKPTYTTLTDHIIQNLDNTQKEIEK